MKKGLLVLVLCTFVATPAMADHFGFTYSNLQTVFDGVNSFSTTNWANSTGSVYRIEAPQQTAQFLAADTAAALEVIFEMPVPTWGSGSEAFSISMTISDMTATSAKGAGSFSIMDVDGDTIAGDLSGTWRKMDGRGTFAGSLGNVTYTSVANDMFDGHAGSASMVFTDPAPWTGTLIQLTAGGGWFTDLDGAPQAFDVTGGSIDAVLPVPGAALLGMLGLSAAGLKLRRRSA